MKTKRTASRRDLGVFSSDQVHSMERVSTQGMRWEARTLLHSLRQRLTCGSRGYNFLRECGYPIPVERNLQRHIQHIKFRPGHLTDIPDPLKMKVSLMKPEERHAALMIDEMQNTSGLVYHSCGRGGAHAPFSRWLDT